MRVSVHESHGSLVNAKDSREGFKENVLEESLNKDEKSKDQALLEEAYQKVLKEQTTNSVPLIAVLVRSNES